MNVMLTLFHLAPVQTLTTFKKILIPLLGLLAAAVYIMLASNHLDAQGLYHDELHQAPAAFAYTGLRPQAFAPVMICGVPVLNMSYSGAVKSAIYGIFLKISGVGFSATNWRMTGILIVATALFLFSLLTRKCLSNRFLIVVYLLLLTDNSLILMTRHDWGPVALAFFLRLMAIGLMLRVMVQAKEISKAVLFVIACLVGFSIFEKLNNIVLLAPGVLFFCFIIRRIRFSHYVSGLGGFTLGLAPLITANLYSYFTAGYLVSLSQVSAEKVMSFHQFFLYAKEYLCLGRGVLVSTMILGEAPGGTWTVWSVPLLSLIALVAGIVLWKKSMLCRAGVLMILCYVATGLLMYFLPRPTSFYHWMVGTPFQYAGLALVASACIEMFFWRRTTIMPILLQQALFIVVGLMIVLPRISDAVWLQSQLTAGKYSHRWSPELSQMGVFAADHQEDAIFVAADWGVATQIICYLNGMPGKVAELFWYYQAEPDFLCLLGQQVKRVYVVNLRPPVNVVPENTRRIKKLVNKLCREDRLRKVQAPVFSTVEMNAYDVVHPPAARFCN
ncbi:MAG: hypothetical protein K8R59_07595 [Thermoanaerobaculales bacterium]|nr:hypothetical protein [Thermoanaerobaculales bacterium]